ncbi:filamentous hemagglutinin family N-terminal domain-containing protein [Variovorax sp. OK212]|nr:filamentous hemagglutinin family N-terminal domain-containing protein [Variovorax sp. OK202]SFD64727.1 filamentous hemagglutinin family N-terminal domain-containing protein [Variovorax sp. OK212]
MKRAPSGQHPCAGLFKTKVSFAISALLLSYSSPGWAAPQGASVAGGVAAVTRTGSVTHIDQGTQRAVINWQGFSIGAGETVNFNQPNASAVTLNRVVGNERSVIDGVLNANGKVFLVNASGVLFTRGSSVNTAGLVASTLDLDNADFEAGRYVFKGSGGSGSVVNMGTLTAASGGYVALLGGTVSNQGVIVATKGTVALASGEKISLNFNGDSLVSVSIDEGTLNALVENKGAVQADGGKVFLTARAADDLLGSQVNNSGIVQARTLDDLKGDIVVHAYGGTASVGGTLDASAPVRGDGGTIETSGRSVKVADDASVATRAANGKTGTWTLDPDGFTIGAGGDIRGTTLGALLGNNNIAIESTGGNGADGHIHVNDAVSWSADTALTLSATNDIRINAPITATGANAGLRLNYGGDYRIDTDHGVSVTLGGANASLAMNGNAYTLVHSMSDLEAIDDAGGVAAGRYALAGNLDASGKTYANTVVSKLSGTLAGLGHTIANLTIAEPKQTSGPSLVETGLIGTAQSGSIVRDIGLSNASVSAYGRVGALAGVSAGRISQAWASGAVTGASSVGGLVGVNNGTIERSYATATVTGSSLYEGYSSIGGLVGQNSGAASRIADSHATGNVTALNAFEFNNGSIGGLAGGNLNGTIANSYATGRVTVSDNAITVGGLVGLTGGATGLITNSYATGDVTGGQGNIGGLAGRNISGGRIVDSYATGNVTGGARVGAISPNFGGLVGENSAGTISGSHASGTVTASSGFAGGLVGSSGGTGASISNSNASGDVKGGAGSYAGGLVGYNSDSSTISGSRASGDVTGENAGGLAGGHSGTITGSEASGHVTGSNAAGGLVGLMGGGTVTDSRASGDVTGRDNVTGGLVGEFRGGVIDKSFATGRVVTESGGPGALVGSNTGTGTVTNSSYRDVAAEAEAQAAARAVAEAAGRAATEAAAAEAAVQAAARASAEEAAQATANATAAAQALAFAAARAAELQARADAGARLASAAEADARRQAEERPVLTTTASLAPRPVAIADHIVFADRRNFSANVQRIEVDGQVFDLEDEAAPPASTAPVRKP